MFRQRYLVENQFKIAVLCREKANLFISSYFSVNAASYFYLFTLCIYKPNIYFLPLMRVGFDFFFNQAGYFCGGTTYSSEIKNQSFIAKQKSLVT